MAGKAAGTKRKPAKKAKEAVKKDGTPASLDGRMLLGAEGWTQVDVGDEVLVGASEGGFMGLEVRRCPLHVVFMLACWMARAGTK